MTGPTVPLSAECDMAEDRSLPELHRYCRSANDVPLPGAHGVLLAAASCCCSCHGGAAATPEAGRR
jgi:hypothetical protein